MITLSKSSLFLVTFGIAISLANVGSSTQPLTNFSEHLSSMQPYTLAGRHIGGDYGV